MVPINNLQTNLLSSAVFSKAATALATADLYSRTISKKILRELSNLLSVPINVMEDVTRTCIVIVVWKPVNARLDLLDPIVKSIFVAMPHVVTMDYVPARYLGGELTVTDKAYICKDEWLGERCDLNPCVEIYIDCGNGKCVELSETEATCECQEGYFFGTNCKERSLCECFCEMGSFPYFGCAGDVAGKIKLGCRQKDGCAYIDGGKDYPYDGFCTYTCYEDNIVFTNPDASPVQQPTPPHVTAKSGCNKCTEDVWDTVVYGHIRGDRISWIASQGVYDAAGSCRFVIEEFPDICT